MGKVPAGPVVIVGVHACGDRVHHPIEFADHPAIEFGPLFDRSIAVRPGQFGRRQLSAFASQLPGRLELVDVGVNHKEAVDVPQPQEEFGDAFLDGLFAVANGGPGGLVGEKIPAEGVGPIAVENLVRLAIIPLALRHLATIFAQHQSQHDAIAIGMRKLVEGGRVVTRFGVVKQQRADRQQAVEPAAGLVDGFADKIGGKLLFKFLLALPGVPPLGERHGTRVVPAVDDVRHAAHPGAGGEGRIVGDLVDVRLVDLQIFRQIGLTSLGLLPRLGAADPRLVQQLVVTGNRFHLARLLADPDRQRGAPIAFAGKGPVDVGLQKVPKASVADVLGQPVDGPVVGQHLFLEGRGADEPAVAGILDQRILFRSPAKRIIVQVLLLMIQQPPLP